MKTAGGAEIENSSSQSTVEFLCVTCTFLLHQRSSRLKEHFNECSYEMKSIKKVFDPLRHVSNVWKLTQFFF